MLPYLAQGANSALEDGAVLGLLLGHVESKAQLPQALILYEKLRKARGDAIARETFKQVSIGYFQEYYWISHLHKDRDTISTYRTAPSNGLGTS
jgi:2-polyprenyl-6-methoxyphenol hydroxylase-like FAD-dependent oxidoreductase